MVDAMKRYQEILAAFTVPGARDYNVTRGGLTYWGKAAGLTAEDIIADAHAVGVRNRDGSIRSGWNTAKPKFINGKPTVDYIPRAAKPKPPPQYPNYVRNLIGADVLEWIAADGGGLHTPGANPEALLELSPCIDFADAPPCAQTSMFLRALYHPFERVHVFDISKPASGIVGENIRTVAEWLTILEEQGEMPGDGILPNPLTGMIGATKDGYASFIADSCIASFPFMLVEFDDVRHAFGGDNERGLAAQYALAVGIVTKSKLSPALVSVVQSGGKSLHMLFYVGAKSRDEWERYRVQMVALFATDPTCVEVARNSRRVTAYPFRADLQSMRPRQATRLAGAWRRDKGKGACQRLVYLNPSARPSPMPIPIDLKSKPPCGDDAVAMRLAGGGSFCGVCRRLTDCPFADPDALPGTTMKDRAKR